MNQSTALKIIENYRAVKSGKKLFIAGTGAVGGTLLKQIQSLNGLNSLQIIGICNSSHQKFYYNDENVRSADLYQGAERKNWNKIIDRLFNHEPGSVIFVDATGSAETADLYPELLRKEIHIVTPSKLANSRNFSRFKELHQIAEEKGVYFRYETNVGAGLPVISTLKNMIETGDEIVQIRGVLSGTLTYIFSELDKGGFFSETVARARTLGYAEPDPRDDLSGEDVARKFLILARTIGLQTERDEISVENLVPESLRTVSGNQFLEQLHQADDEWRNRFKKVKENGHTLRYTGLLKENSVTVGVEPVPLNSPFGRLAYTNNLIEIKSRRYYDQPLIIQGPGAGKEVTAAGVLADIRAIV